MSTKNPFISIVIPTRNRAHLLPFAIRSALEQEFDDYEIVVVANNCHDNTREVVQSFASNRIQYFETDKILTMPENWHYAWTKARGDYITYLSDDDALAASTLKVLVTQALHDSPKLISWEDAVYYYPNWHDKNLSNTLLLFNFGDEVIEDISTLFYLDQLRRFDFAWSSPLPKLLNCLVDRKHFEKYRQLLGTLFFPIAPDYSFGWIATQICTTMRIIHLPLSIRGISHNSIGSDAGLGNSGREFYKEFGDLDFFAETQIDAPVTINHIAATFIRVNNAFIKCGMEPTTLDKDAFMLALGKQLVECRELLPNWKIYADNFIDRVNKSFPFLLPQINSIFNQQINVNNPESLRDLHKRTAKMAAEYPGNLKLAQAKHSGDEGCGACTLAFRQELLVEPEWSHLILFCEQIDAHDPYIVSKYVDHYYNLLTSCKKKKALAKSSVNNQMDNR